MSDEAMRRLRRENPVSEATPAPELPIEPVLARLSESNSAGRPVSWSRARAHRGSLFARVRTPKRWLLPAGAAISVVCGAIVFAVGTGSTSPASAAAAQLQKLAGVAAAQSPVAPPADGRYLSVRSVQAGGSVQGNCTVVVPEHRQIWINAKGAGRILEIPGTPSFATAREKLSCERSHQQMLADVTARRDMWYAPGCYSLGDAGRIRANLNDPRALLRDMHTIEGGPSGPSSDFLAVGSFLRESDASPALRAAIFRAAATIPGVKLVGTVTDRVGRRGVAMVLVSHDSANLNTTFEMIFDPHDSSLLADQATVTSTGRKLAWDVYQQATVVSRIPGRMPAGLSPPCRNGLSYGHISHRNVTLMTGAR